MQIARQCADAKEYLSADEKKELFGKLLISAPTFSKYAKIGTKYFLYEQDVFVSLPPSFSALYAGLFSAAACTRVLMMTAERLGRIGHSSISSGSGYWGGALPTVFRIFG
jgi:hypothetical protein